MIGPNAYEISFASVYLPIVRINVFTNRVPTDHTNSSPTVPMSLKPTSEKSVSHIIRRQLIPCGVQVVQVDLAQQASKCAGVVMFDVGVTYRHFKRHFCRPGSRRRPLGAAGSAVAGSAGDAPNALSSLMSIRCHEEYAQKAQGDQDVTGCQPSGGPPGVEGVYALACV